MSTGCLRIGLSSCFFHADQERDIFRGKTLIYAELTMAKWVMSLGAIPVLIPPISGKLNWDLMLGEIDGLILQGGSDLAPSSYRENQISERWPGDKIRDDYELELVDACLKRHKPILGVCRGAQLLNVYFGGTLYQDIPSQCETHTVHRDASLYDKNIHELEVVQDSLLAGLYPDQQSYFVNSIHHQGLKDLGQNLIVEATSKTDQFVEAFRLNSKDQWVYGVQWHPEFIFEGYSKDLLDSGPILNEFFSSINRVN